MSLPSQPYEFRNVISEADAIKIRRLILTKLFRGWHNEVRYMKGNYYKAAQIMARSIRRGGDTLWVREVVLVSFHMWHRYAAVKVTHFVTHSNFIIHTV